MSLSDRAVSRWSRMRLNKGQLANLVIVIIGVAVLVSLGKYKPVHAAACTASVATVTQKSSPAFYLDMPTFSNGYVAYQVSTGASGSFTDLWVKLDSFTSSGAVVLGLSSTDDGLYHIGALSNNSSAYSYFYLAATATTSTAQNYTIHLYNGRPGSGGIETCSSAQSNSSVKNTGSNNSNTVSSVTYTAPYIGGDFTMTVIGDSGTIGQSSTPPGVFSYTPASLGSWDADCLELKDTSVSMTGGNTGTFAHIMYFSGLNSSTTHYTLTYTFTAKCVTATSTTVEPLSYFSQGNNFAHTSVSNYGTLPPIEPATNSLVISKSVSPGSSTDGGTATYYVNVTNSGPATASLDDFTDTLPSSPANATYINGTTTYDDDISGGSSAAGISNPSSSGQTLTWVRAFSVPSGKTAQLSYQVTIPSTTGSYVNSVVAHSGSTQIDQTSDTTDNMPATSIYGVGSLSLASSTKTASDINGGSLQPGDTIQYTINAVASGTQDATGVRVQDTIDINTNNLSNVVVGASATNCGSTYSNNSTSTALDITNISIAHGTTCQITFNVLVKSNAADGATVLNSAIITSTVSGAISGNPSSTPMIVHKDPILSVTNVENDADNVVIANQVITYTTTITNTGQATGNGIDLVATITGPVGSLSSRTLTNCGSTYVDTSSSLTINIAALSVTTSNPCVISYTYTVNAGVSSGTVTNSVDITAAREGGNDPAAVSASNLLIGAAPTPPSLAVTVAEDDVDNLVTPGQSITYTITITNSGQTDATTSLTSAIPTELGSPGTRSYTNCGSPSSSFSAPTLTITSISVAAANTCTISFSIIVDTPLDEGTAIIVGADVAAASQGGNNPANVNATTLTVDATPVLAVSFAENDADNLVTPSQDITYTLTINNTGNGSATIVGATDTLIGPAGDPGSFNFSNCGVVYTNSSTGSLNVVDLTIAVGTPCVVTYHRAVNSNANGGETIANSADVTAASEGGDNPIPVAASTLTVTAMPDLAVTTTEDDSDNIVTPGQTVTYTTTITNNGSGSATGIGLVDTFTGSLSSIGSFSFSGCGGAYSNNSSGNIVTLTGLQAASGGGTCQITYVATVSGSAAGGSTITNSANASAASQGGNNPDAVSATSLTVATIPSLFVTVEDNDVDNVVTPSQVVTFTVTINNSGNGTANTTATVTMPDEVGSPGSINFSNCGSAGSSYSSPTLSLSSLTITTAHDCVVTFTATVDNPNTEGATFTVSADVATASEGGNNPDAEPSSVLTVNTTPNLSTSTMSQTDANGGTLKPGETLNYTITLKNTGDGVASGVSLQNSILDQLSFDAGTLSFSNCGGGYTDNSTSSGLDIVGLEIQPGTDCVITYSAVTDSPLDEGTNISANATISAASQGGSGASPSTSTLQINATPNLSTSTMEVSDVDGDNLKPADVLEYTITIKNTGDGTASGITATDGIDSDATLNLGSISATGCGTVSDSSVSGQLNLSGIVIAAGSDCVITYRVTLKSPLNEGTALTGDAVIGAATEGGSGANLTTSTLNVDATPQLGVTLSDDDDDNIVNLGQTVNGQAVISNTGDGEASGVSFSYVLTSPGESIADISTYGCGASVGQHLSGTTLTFDNLTVAVGTNCVVSWSFMVASDASDGAAIGQTLDVGAATEGGNTPDQATTDNLIVDVSNAAPNTPVNVSSTILIGNHVYPVDGLNGAALSSDLTDPNTGDQVRYRIQIGTNSSFTTDVVIDYRADLGSQGSQTYTYQTTSGTYLIGNSATELADGSYYIRIRNEDNNGANSAWYVVPGVAFRYDTTPPGKPDAPFLIGEAGVGTATIGWDATTDPDPDATLPYRLEYSTDPEFGTFIDIDSADLSKLLSSLSSDTHYYFRIYWRDAAGNMSEASDALDVYIPKEETPPPDPEPTPDDPGAPDTDTTPRLPIGGPVAPVISGGRSSIIADTGEGDTTTVIITVKDIDGKPLKGAKVTLHSKPRVGYTDKDGVVIFYDVPIGKHGVIVEYAGRFTESTLITLKRGVQQLKVDLTLNKPEVYHSWWWLWLLLLIPLYMYYRHRKKVHNKRAEQQKS